MNNLIVPTHRVEQVVNTIFSHWDEKPFRRYAQEHEGMYGCYACFCVNGIVYIDSELYGQFNSDSNLELVAQVMELQTKWANGDYKTALLESIKSLA